jgi:hypothetical protein
MRRRITRSTAACRSAPRICRVAGSLVPAPYAALGRRRWSSATCPPCTSGLITGRFREPGFSKGRRLDPQITVGLLADAVGFPLGRRYDRLSISKVRPDHAPLPHHRDPCRNHVITAADRMPTDLHEALSRIRRGPDAR